MGLGPPEARWKCGRSGFIGIVFCGCLVCFSFPSAQGGPPGQCLVTGLIFEGIGGGGEGVTVTTARMRSRSLLEHMQS